MARVVVEAALAQGSLVVDPKDYQQAWGQPAPGTAPHRALAWDEDATTLAVAAVAALAPDRLDHVVVGPGIDVETLLAAAGLAAPALVAHDPMAVARGLSGRALAVGADVAGHPLVPEASRGVAAIVDEGEADVAAPREAAQPAVAVTAARALLESRALPPPEPVPGSPMGAYVPWGTWIEDLPARLRLVAQECARCRRIAYPPRGACPACRARVFADVRLPEEARVYAATRIGRGGAPSEFALEQAQTGAYWVGVVEWPDPGVRVTARLAAFAREPRPGDRVRPVVRRLFEQEGRVRYGVKFAPAPA